MRVSIENFISRATTIHPGKYEYFISEETLPQKVKIRCNQCKSVFIQNWAYHLRGCGCPFCANTKVNHTNSLGNLFPNLVKEWGNNNFSIYDVVPLSEKEVEWKCTNGHLYRMKIWKRTKSNQSCTLCKSFAYRFPDLIKLWHSTKNNELPNDVSAGSGKLFWWLCSNGHEFKSTLNTIVNYKSKDKCPYCCNRLTSKERSLGQLYPTLSKEWSIDNKITPFDVSSKSRKNVIWICPKCHSEYSARIDHRTCSNSGCPFCFHKGQFEVGVLLKQTFRIFNIQQQKYFQIDGRKRFYDFWMEYGSLKIIVEYDGEQHFKPILHFGGKESLEKQQIIDHCDKVFCRNNDILLFRIAYNQNKQNRVRELASIVKTIGDFMYEKKIEEARKVIDIYNNEQENKIEIEDFLKKLKKLGGSDESLLTFVSYEDLEDCGLPKLLAKKIASIFREPARPDVNAGPNERVVSRMNVLNLLQQYDPNDPDNIVARELKKRSQGKRFVVLTSEGKVLVQRSNELYIEVVQKNFPERETVSVDGHDYRTYPVGEGKAELYDESPIFAGRVLRPDGTDDQLNRSWDGVPVEVRQLIRVAVDQGEIRPTLDSAHATLDIAIGADAMKKLRERYKKSSVRFNELKELGDLPKLKITRVSASRTKQNDPFYGSGNNKTY